MTEDDREAARTAVALVRARLDRNDDSFRALCLGIDPWDLLVPLADLSAELVKLNVGKAWPQALDSMALHAASLATEP